MFTLAIALEELINLLETKEYCLLSFGKNNQKIVKFEHYPEILNIMFELSRDRGTQLTL
jgi:hypothetical protein